MVWNVSVLSSFGSLFAIIHGIIRYIDVHCWVYVNAETAVVQAPAETIPAITVTTDEQLTAEEKNKGAYEQLKELLESEKQQQVLVTLCSRSVC